MKKFLIISSFFMVMMSFSLIGYRIVSANEKVDEIVEQLEQQKSKERYLTPYGYTLNNPNIIKNPYGDSPLTALILFETNYKTPITLKILDEENKTLISNTFSEDTKHIIPIYGLSPNTENKIEIITNKETKSYTVKTEEITIDQSLEGIATDQSKLTIIKDKNKLYGIDNNHKIKWYYKNDVELSPVLLKNGHILIEVNNQHKYSLIEIDLLGKIYKQINLEDKVYDIKELENTILLLSSHLTEIDWDSGQIINNYELKNNYEKIKEVSKDDIILISENKQSKLNLNTKQEQIIDEDNIITPTNIKVSLYRDNTNYKIKEGISFENKHETVQSKDKILLINYKKIDDDYKNYDIKIKKTRETIIVSGRFQKQDNVHIILDKFLDKRIYDIKDEITIINQSGLSGKYSIYLKINNKIYKTNTYINI